MMSKCLLLIKSLSAVFCPDRTTDIVKRTGTCPNLFSEDGIVQSISQINARCCAGSDGFCMSFWNGGKGHLSKTIAVLFQSMLQNALLRNFGRDPSLCGCLKIKMLQIRVIIVE